MPWFDPRIQLLVEELSREPAPLGGHLRGLRLELGLRQKDVAVRIGVTTSTIWNREHGWT
ncbi:MAG: helix-turn-helix domain-containing protein, partial [Desulfuromonadaceae bacterium]|nr:helix-turn-helix domain-containing protein [Desulfuromonadaceae bacterium]